ncbi:MAG: tetratricopeptide repeat protein [Nitrospiraceae bacterium]|nr:tetratricopeptide repeat protein [Nitrospiraceae bacterium]
MLRGLAAGVWVGWTGVYRYRADDTGRAIGALRRATRLRPGFSLAHAYIGITYEVKKDPVNALKAYRKTIAVEPQFSFAWRKIGWLHFQAKRYADSAKAFGEYVELEPGSAFGHYCLGAAYHESHQYDKAVTSLERALEMGIDRDTASDVLYRLRLIRRKRGF